MNNKNSKRALLTSVLSLAVCGSMLVGTTFAWFTDSVSSNNNVITAGNLDVELYYKTTEMETYETVEETTNVFKKGVLWEPGHVEVVNLKVANEGTLALKYQLGIEVASEVAGMRADGTTFNLSDYIKYAIVDGEQTYESSAKAIEAVAASATTLSTAYNKETAVLKAETEETEAGVDRWTMVVYMPTEIGNEANYDADAAKGKVPTINLGINLLATQAAFEEDSFGNGYDKDAGYNYGKKNVGPYKLNVLSNGIATYDDATKTYTITVDTIGKGGYNEKQGKTWYAGYTVNVAGYDAAKATVKFYNVDGTETPWYLAEEERDGFITNGIHQQWTRVGRNTAYRYDIDGDGVTDFTVVNDASAAKVEVATAEQLAKALELGKTAILVADIDHLTEGVTVPADATVTLDLNGKTLSCTSEVAAANSAITNNGTLTITNGTVTYTSEKPDANNGYVTNTITNNGDLTIIGATIINGTTDTDGGTSYAIENTPGSTLVVESGYINSVKNAIRVREGSDVTINNGNVISETGHAIIIHKLASTSTPTKLTINGGTFTTGKPEDYLALYSYAYGNITFENTFVKITGGTFNGAVGFGAGNKKEEEKVEITGGTFNGALGRYTADGWVDIEH